jgi:glutathione synthase/RimK-type ligase-like ATP-grasp enzyme
MADGKKVRGPKIAGIYRELIYSPGKVYDDAAILDASLAELLRFGCEVVALKAEDLESFSPCPAWALNMAQSERALRILEEWSGNGTRVINSVNSIRNCYRKPLVNLLVRSEIPLPQSEILPLDAVEREVSFGVSASYWIKRGDVHATQPEDVVRVESRDGLLKALRHFRDQGVSDVLVQEHVQGQTIKFYGVGKGEYFSAFVSPGPKDVSSRVDGLMALAIRSAELLGLEIYGGDVIVMGDGSLVLVDLNDWPSFSMCKMEAAKGIARYVGRLCSGGIDGLSAYC